MLRIPVHLSVGIDERIQQMTSKDLLVLDEGDWHLLDELRDLPKKSYGVIAMTATDVGSDKGNEKRRLD